MGSGKVLASVLAGAAAGAVLGILFAPDKGAETRRKLAERGADLTDNLKSKASEYADVLSDKYDSAKEKLTGLASEGRDMYNQAKDKASNLGNTMKSDVRNSMNS